MASEHEEIQRGFWVEFPVSGYVPRHREGYADSGKVRFEESTPPQVGFAAIIAQRADADESPRRDPHQL